jgi:PST family polysaccharide transporter
VKVSEVTVFFADNQIVDGHARRALRSGAVSIVARSANAVIQIGSVLGLARLLSPEDYGLVGMVAAITGFAPVLVDLGSRDAIVQRTKIAEGEVSALFWMTQIFGFGCAVLVACSGPTIARFYGEPRLTLIAVVSSLTFITSALTAAHYALLRRAMMFHELGVAEVAANLISALLALTVALYGFHYWALVLRPIAATFFLAAGVWFQCRWIPPRPTVTPAVKSMVRFGLNVTGFTMTDFVGKSSDRIAIGYRIGAAGLGYYQNALFVYENLIDIALGPLHGVAVSGLSKLRSDPDGLRRSWAKALSTLAFYSMPAFGLLAVLSRDLILILLGAKWAQSGLLLSVLALRGIPHLVEKTAGWLHVVAGRTDRWMRWGVFVAGVQLVALAVGLQYGPAGVVTAYVVTMFALFAPAITYAGRPLELGATDMLRAVWRPMLGSLLSTGIGVGVRGAVFANVAPLPRTVLLALVYLMSYLIIVVGVLGLHAPINTMFSLCEEVLPSRLVSRIRAVGFVDKKGYEHV